MVMCDAVQDKKIKALFIYLLLNPVLKVVIYPFFVLFTTRVSNRLCQFYRLPISQKPTTYIDLCKHIFILIIYCYSKFAQKTTLPIYANNSSVILIKAPLFDSVIMKMHSTV